MTNELTAQQFEDAENTSFNYMKDKISFRDIILQHLKKISQLSSVEFRGGYWETTPIILQGASTYTKKYVPDSREMYSNAVECFADMLCPYFDKEMKKAEEEAEEELKGLENSSKEEHSHKKRKINKKLFRALCSFLFRKKYLELGSIED